MIDLFAMVWTVLIFTSIAWYAALLFYIGVKGGREIVEMTRTLGARPDPDAAAKVDKKPE
jgi:hypothetical protein